MQEVILRLWCSAQTRWHELKSSERGATAVEYSIMVALIAAVVMAVVQAIGNDTNGQFNSLEDQWGGDGNPPPPPVP